MLLGHHFPIVNCSSYWGYVAKIGKVNAEPSPMEAYDGFFPGGTSMTGMLNGMDYSWLCNMNNQVDIGRPIFHH